MINKPKENGLDLEQVRSRRSVFKWIGQVAAGASLAGIGLGLANPLNALAASKGTDMPRCIPCELCHTTSCQGGICEPPENYVTYKYYKGCVFQGQSCPYVGTYKGCFDGCSAC